MTGPRVFDVGAGAGALSRRLISAPPGLRPVLVDLSPGGLAGAADLQAPRAVASVQAVPFADDVPTSGCRPGLSRRSRAPGPPSPRCSGCCARVGHSCTASAQGPQRASIACAAALPEPSCTRCSPDTSCVTTKRHSTAATRRCGARSPEAQRPLSWSAHAAPSRLKSETGKRSRSPPTPARPPWRQPRSAGRVPVAAATNVEYGRNSVLARLRKHPPLIGQIEVLHTLFGVWAVKHIHTVGKSVSAHAAHWFNHTATEVDQFRRNATPTRRRQSFKRAGCAAPCHTARDAQGP